MIIQSQHTIVIFLSLVLVLLAGCSQQQVASGPPDNLVVKETGTGPGKKDVEIIKINNCDGKAPATQVAERGQSVQLGGGTSLGASGGLVQAAVMGNYSTGAYTTKSLQLTAPPGTHMEYNLEWTMEERNGMVIKEGVTADPALYRHFRPVDVRIVLQKDRGCEGGSSSEPVSESSSQLSVTPDPMPRSNNAPPPVVAPRPTETAYPTRTPQPTSTPENTNVSFEVKGTAGWQHSNVFLSPGDEVSVRYVNGGWTVDRRNHKNVDASGHADAGGGYILRSGRIGALVGRIGDGTPFLIGNGLDFQTNEKGALWLRIDDSDEMLGDNSGSITVSIDVVRTGAARFKLRPTSTPEDVNTTFEVKSWKGWQHTNLFLSPGDQVKIRYVSGSWTIDTRNYKKVDASGHADAGRGTFVSDGRAGALVGYIGDGDPFLVGNALDLRARTKGPLWLRMDDGDRMLEDNDGTIIVSIAVVRQH